MSKGKKNNEVVFKELTKTLPEWLKRSQNENKTNTNSEKKWQHNWPQAG